MKKSITLALFLLMGGFAAVAQVEVSVSFDQDQFLPNEPLIVKVRILNSSGQTLTLGKGDWLNLSVEAERSKIIEQTKALDTDGVFTVPTSYRATKNVDINGKFELNELGHYSVIATVRIEEWGANYSSKPRSFDLSPGTTLKEITFGLPGEEGNKKPEFRKYMLVQANHLKHIRLYARVTDLAGEHTFKIFSLGTMNSFSKPEAQLDNWNNLHVLFQHGAKSFTFSTVSPEGLLMTRETWDYTVTRPGLQLTDKGAIRVVGGVRRVSGNDLPPPDFEEQKKVPAEVVPASEPPATVDAKPLKK